jgi:hypothetical protein
MVKPDWSQYSRKDREFLLQTTLANRGFITQTFTFVYGLLVSVTALLVAGLSVYLSIAGFSKDRLLVPIVILAIIIISWVAIPSLLKKKIHSGIHNCNVQYQEILKSLHPELIPDIEFYY